MNRLVVLCLALFALAVAPVTFAQKGFTTPVGTGTSTSATAGSEVDAMENMTLEEKFQAKADAYVEAHPEKAEALLLNLYLLKMRLIADADAFDFLGWLVEYVAGLVKEMNEDSSVVAMVMGSSSSDSSDEETADEAMPETTEETTTEEDTTDAETGDTAMDADTDTGSMMDDEETMTDTGAVASGTVTTSTSGSRKNN